MNVHALVLLAHVLAATTTVAVLFVAAGVRPADGGLLRVIRRAAEALAPQRALA